MPSSITSFEDLYVYSLAREFNKNISKLIKMLPDSEKYNLKSQMSRAKLSITNNIAEGFGRYHYQENIQFCRQSRGSICELIDDFNECFDEGYIDKNLLDTYKKEGYSLIKVLNSYIASQKKQKKIIQDSK
ncbi:MAG: four helix bundle protein [Proteobacteria bacterium]|nr:four helix bundle protein [Pseudomonadota bacterium]